MENFIVSARKYRPATFTSVVGQASITTTLKNAIKNNHLAQAYLFCGPRGVGKTTCARIFAKTINCKNLTDKIEACNKCESCETFNNSSAYNIHELDAASNNSVEDIRNLIDQVRIPPQVGKYSIYIIDEVHMLSAQAFNAFLKTLEEPPAHAIFILATTEKHKIIPTILSRCQIFDFNRIKVNDIVEYLGSIASNEGVESEPEAFNVIAQKADGAMRDALSIFDQVVSFSGEKITYKDVIENLNVLDLDYYFKLTESLLNTNISESLLIFNEILDNGFDAHHFITGLSEHFRNVLVGKDEVTLQLIEVSSGVKEKFKEQAKKCSIEFLIEALSISNSCDLGYKISQNKRLHVELALIQLCNLMQEKKKEPELNTEKKNKIIETVKEKDTKDKGDVEKKTENFVEKVILDAGKRNTVTPSIKDALLIKKNETVCEPEKEYESSDQVAGEQNQQFTQEELVTVWKQYAESIKHSRKRLYNTLIADDPVLKADNKIEIIVSNPLQSDAINEVRHKLLKYLQQYLNNSSVDLETTIKEQKEESKLYTLEDKFNHMIQKNENLKLLKQKLNLDFD